MGKNTEKQVELQQKLIKGEDISRQLSSQRSKIEAKRLIIAAKINYTDALSSDQKDVLLAKLREQFDIENTILDTLAKQNQELEDKNTEAEKSQGLMGSALKGIEGTLKKAGFGDLAKKLNFKDAIDGATTFDETTGKATFNAGKSFKSLGTNLKNSISKGDVLSLILAKLAERAGQADKNIANLRRNFGASFNEARKLNDEFGYSAIKSGDVTANIESLSEANQGINSQLGIQVRYQDDLLIKANALVKRNNQSQEAVAGFAELTLASGENAETLYQNQSKVVAEIQNSSKVALNFNNILEEANKTTGLLRVNLGRTPEGIAKAVANARTLGITLNDAAQISGKLLDFQSSIEAELEAEVLTGKNLNLEQARYLALTGKTDEAAAEVLKQVGSLAEFQQLNVLQQQALADATGLTVDQLADQVTKQAAINSQKEDGLAVDAKAQAENASALSVQQQLASAVEKLNSILQISGVIIGGIIGAVAGFFLGGPVGALIGAIGGAALVGGTQHAVSDGVAPPGTGPFTITDSYGATTITAPGDGLAISPNINTGGGGGVSDAKFDKMVALLEKISNKSTTLQMDGRTLAKSIETSPISSNMA